MRKILRFLFEEVVDDAQRMKHDNGLSYRFEIHNISYSDMRLVCLVRQTTALWVTYQRKRTSHDKSPKTSHEPSVARCRGREALSGPEVKEDHEDSSVVDSNTLQRSEFLTPAPEPRLTSQEGDRTWRLSWPFEVNQTGDGVSANLTYTPF